MLGESRLPEHAVRRHAVRRGSGVVAHDPMVLGVRYPERAILPHGYPHRTG